ncbi:hypothetical protein Poli38472_002620 [Pythium oligandrum]|uniref:Trichohyalin-plectin-homology domain-containing protein n=1 Tax=Pythium oligandrum TaxID=41045 RepID=A0A8K1CIH7_PYTOL|nr:hypothetical protein Poli38472_002620 [Pythium oligandrum]|eukprot:TMW63679.1 hypothetical protein Poli38472_002620 [Pythium oligandrum]
MLTTRRRNLSPLKTRRVQQSTPQQKNEFSSLEEAMVDDQAQIKEEARLIKAFEDWEKQRSRAVAKHYKLSQLEQSRAKEERRLERKLDNMVIQEQMEWERTQLELVEQAQRQARGNQRRLLRDEHARTLEIDRRREGAAKITRHFFDRLAVLDPEPALEMFTAKRDELVRCCLELMRDFADDNEIEAFQAELQESLQREVNTLRCRQRAFQQEQRVQTHKKQVHQDMRRAQYQEIQTHLQAKRDTRTTDRVVREEIDKQHDLQDQRYRAMQARKKQKDLDVHTKLLEQMRLKQAEKAVVSLRIEGKTSPVLRTPYWSDEAQEAQLDTFVRSSPIVQAPESPVIRGKVRCQWYD